MTGTVQRRDLLRVALAAPVACACARAALAQSSSLGLQEVPLRGGLFRIAGAGGNIVVLEHGGRLAIVDSGAPRHADNVASLVAARHADTRADVLFNTHWHLEHTGGNDALRETVLAADAPIVAHENTRLWMSTEFHVDWEDETYPARPPSARPTKTFRTSDPQPRELELGGRRIVYGHLREAHTDGDIYVQFPDANVVAAGGAVTDRTWPIMDFITGGWIGGLVDATEKLIGISDAETLIVPQAGPPQSRADLEAQRDMLATVRERMESMALEGKSAEEMVAAGITSGFDERFGGNKGLFISNAYDGLWWGNRLRGIIA